MFLELLIPPSILFPINAYVLVFFFSPPAKTSKFDFSSRAGASLVDDDYSDDDLEPAAM